MATDNNGFEILEPEVDGAGFEIVNEPVAAVQSPERQARQAATRAELESARKETVPLIWTALARAGSGLEKGLTAADRLQYGLRDALNFQAVEKAIGLPPERGTQAWLDYYKARDQQLAQEHAQIESGQGSVAGFVNEAVEGTARAAAELPLQLVAGAGAATPAQAVARSAAAGGVMGGGQEFSQARAGGADRLDATLQAGTSGLITAITTRAFGATGVESIFKNEGVKGIAKRLASVAGAGAAEGGEELVDEFQQDLAERISRSPDKPIGETVKELLMAATIGGVTGSGVNIAGQAINGRNVDQNGFEIVDEPAVMSPEEEARLRSAGALPENNDIPATNPLTIGTSPVNAAEASPAPASSGLSIPATPMAVETEAETSNQDSLNLAAQLVSLADTLKQNQISPKVTAPPETVANAGGTSTVAARPDTSAATPVVEAKTAPPEALAVDESSKQRPNAEQADTVPSSVVETPAVGSLPEIPKGDQYKAQQSLAAANTVEQLTAWRDMARQKAEAAKVASAADPTNMDLAQAKADAGYGSQFFNEALKFKQPAAEIGVGGARAGEIQSGTSLKHAVTEMERAGLGLNDAPPKERQKMADAWERSAQASPDAGRKIVLQLQADPRTALVDDDSAILLRYRQRLENEINDAAEASHRGDETALKRRGELLAELEELTDATDVRGSHAGRELRWRQAISQEDFSFATQAARLRSDLRANGGDITPETLAELEAKLTALEAKLKEAREAAAKGKSESSTAAIDEAHTKAKSAAKSGKSKGDLAAARNRLTQSVADATIDDDLASIVQQLFRGHVAADLNASRDVIADRVLDDLSKMTVDLSRDEFDTIISGFGKYTELSKEAVAVRARELRREYLLTKQIRELEAKRPLLKTGKEIAAWTDEHRRLLKQKNEAKRRHGVVVTDPARQLKSAQDARKTALRNQVADLQWQIDNRTKIVKNKTKAATDAEIEQLTADRDAVLAKFNEAFPKDPEVELLKRAADLEKQIAAKTKQLAEGVQPVEAKPVNRPADPRLEPLIQQRDTLNKAIAEARKQQSYSREKEIAKQLRKLERAIAERQRVLAAGAPVQPKSTQVNRPADPALEKARQELDAINEQIRKTRLESEDRYMKVLERRMAEYERRKREGDFLPKPKPERKLSKEAAKKLAEANAAAVDFREWREGKIREQWSTAKKIWHGAKSGAGASVNVVSSYDLSAARQLAGAIFSNAPKALYDWPGFYRVLARPFGRMFQGGWSEARAGELEQQRLARPNAESGADKAAKIEYSALDSKKFTKHEENAHSVLDHWAKLPLFDKASPIKSGLSLPVRLGAKGVRISNRAFATALNEVRAAMFDELLRINYSDRPPTKQELAVIGNMVNVATGRGKMSPMSVSVLSKALWSPKLLASRVQALTGQPLWTEAGTFKDTLRARKIVAQEYAKAAASMTLLYLVAGALSDKENDDPRSSDFGKIVDDDTRIDPWGGLQQPLVAAARTYTGETTTLSGKTKSIGADKDFGQRGTYHLWSDFVRSKLRPDVGVAVNLITGSDTMGNEATLANQLPTMTTPLSLRELGPLIEAHGIPKGLGYETLNLLGIGVNVYDEDNGGFRPSR